MLMKRIRLKNNSCDVVHLISGHFNQKIAGFATVDSEARAAEYAAAIPAFATSHPWVEISDLEDDYDNGTVELFGDGPIKYGSTELVAAYVPDEGEPVWDMDLKQLLVGDGETPGGVIPSFDFGQRN